MTFSEVLGLIQRFTNTQNTTTSSYPLADKATDVNSALNKFIILAIQSEGKWQVDDSNNTDFPIIKGDLKNGQQDYTFYMDANGNQVMDIYRVEIFDSTGIASQLRPIDQSELKGIALTEFMKTSGIPTYYDKTANGVFLYPAPNYNYTGGIKFYVNRTPTYFVATDTTKKAGIPWAFHEYLAIRPSYFYCLQKGLPQANALGVEMLRFEEAIGEFFSKRTKDEPQRIKTIYRSSR